MELAFRDPDFRLVRVSTRADHVNWGHRFLQVERFWNRTRGEGVTVGVVDSGIAVNHPDLRHAIRDSKSFVQSAAGVTDEIGHGTHVAGIIAALDDGQGVVGVAPDAMLLNAKVTAGPGTPIDPSAVAAGIRWVVASGCHIVSLSVTSQRKLPGVRRAVKYALERGAFVVCAAGNHGDFANSVSYPAAYPETIAVGYVEERGSGEFDVGALSAQGPEIDLVAPGGAVVSSYPPNLYAEATGTSMAAPFVAGVTALLLAAGARVGSQEELRHLLTESAIDLYRRGRDDFSGWGLINPEEVLEAR